MTKVSTSIIFVLICVYTYLRYVIYGGIHPSQTPLFLLNKAVSFFACTLFLIAALKSQFRKQFIHLSTLAILLHCLLSLLLVGTKHFDKYKSHEGYDLFFSLSLLFGILSLITLGLVFNQSKKFVTELFGRKDLKVKMTTLFYFLVGLHLIFLGFRSWIDVNSWHGNLAPISLLSFGVIALSQILHIKNSRSSKPETSPLNSAST